MCWVPVLASEGWWEAWQLSPQGNQEPGAVSGQKQSWKIQGKLGISKSIECDIFPSMFWHLVGRQEGHPACKKIVLVCWWWWFDWSFAQLVQLSPPPPSSFASRNTFSWKMAIKMERERVLLCVTMIDNGLSFIGLLIWLVVRIISMYYKISCFKILICQNSFLCLPLYNLIGSSNGGKWQFCFPQWRCLNSAVPKTTFVANILSLHSYI